MLTKSKVLGKLVWVFIVLASGVWVFQAFSAHIGQEPYRTRRAKTMMVRFDPSSPMMSTMYTAYSNIAGELPGRMLSPDNIPATYLFNIREGEVVSFSGSAAISWSGSVDWVSCTILVNGYPVYPERKVYSSALSKGAEISCEHTEDG